MKNNIYILLCLILASFLFACGKSAGDAGKVLRNEKISNSDEFLVKKREPLSMPPDYRTIPEPGSLKKNKMQDKKSINRMLKIPSEQPPLNNKVSTVEQSIINQIGK